MSDKQRNGPRPHPDASCFLTTATVQALGMSDHCEPLQLARFLRDEKMISSHERDAVKLYYKVAPVIVSRSTDSDWIAFWSKDMRKITALIKVGEYDLAKKLYVFATARLVNNKATRYADIDIVDNVYSFGLKDFGKRWLPYPIRFVLLKAALACNLMYNNIRLGLAKRKFVHILES